MDLQEKLIELSEYNVSFNVANGNFVIKVKYNDKWTIIKPDNNDIAFYRDESDDSIYYYVAPITISIDKLFLAIDETIEYNRELELKVELFKNKMVELQEIFAQESLDVLNTLEFKIRKKKTKKEKSNKENDEVIDNKTNEDNEELNGEIENTEVKEENVSEIDAKISKLLNK